MESAIFLALVMVLLHLINYFIRYVYFYRHPKVDQEVYLDSAMCLASPVEGTVVYVKRVTNSGEIVKDGRSIDIDFLEKDVEYFQIGIFMTPYNNHHLVAPSHDTVIDSSELVGTEYRSMMSVVDLLMGKSWYKDWYERKRDQFLLKNARTVFLTNWGIMALIYDEYVNKLTLFDEDEDRRVIGFVHRGSQVDVFVPSSKYTPVVDIGTRVSFDTLIVIGK